MNVDRPHEIQEFRGPPKLKPNDTKPRRWIRLTDSEAELLAEASVDERAKWLSAMPHKEYLRRLLQDGECPESQTAR